MVLAPSTLEKNVIHFLSAIANTLLTLRAIFQWMTAKTSWPHTRNRFGFASYSRPEGMLIWVHAASLGELSSARPFLSYLCEQFPNQTLLITTNNPTALSVAENWADIRACFQAAPIDSARTLKRFLTHKITQF